VAIVLGLGIVLWIALRPRLKRDSGAG
jgi:hypothetical protein